MRRQHIRACFSAFGVSVELDAGRDEFVHEDSLWRVREIYERFIALHTLPEEGLAVDLGAGFGAFAIPFALANPKWKVICFEPGAGNLTALHANIAAHGLSEAISAIGCAIGPGGTLSPVVRDALRSRDPERIQRAATRTTFRRSLYRPGFLNAGTRKDWRRSGHPVWLPAIPADGLAELGATLVKYTTPGLEADVINAVAGRVPFITGESWVAPRASDAWRSEPEPSRIYAPLAGSALRLRREPDAHGRREGLDVVVAMYNARDWIVECIDGIVRNDAQDVRAIVVDDGSTDGCGDLVAQRFGGNNRVRVVRKPNGGCASARNFGRLESDATHIAFVDSDDFTDAAFFPTLLEFARYSGGPVTQGAYDEVTATEDGVRRDPSTEAQDFRGARRHPFRDTSYYYLNADALVPGRPTIWRRVYRRDFLDDRNIWFPEHIRAFDDQIFHMLTLHYAERILCTDAVAYHYRQHPGQDIRHVDERGFYSIEMYRTALKRAVVDGWADFAPFVLSFSNTINWTAGTIRPDLRERFLRGAAELWVLIGKVMGEDAFRLADATTVEAPEFKPLVAGFQRRYGGDPASHAWAHVSSIDMFPDLVRASARLRS